MRIVRKRKRHEFEVGGARFYSDRNFTGIGVAGDINAAIQPGRGNNWAHDLIRAVVTGWDGVLDSESDEPLSFHPDLLEHIPPQHGVELAGKIIERYEEEAARTEKELGESRAGAGS